MNTLIVEDDYKLASVIKRGLAQEGFVSEIVDNTDDADSYIEAQEYDVILLDWMLPGKLDGLAWCQKIRKKGYEQPIIMLTAKHTTKDKIDGLNIGADDYIGKPFAFDELVARMRAVLRRKNAKSNPNLSAGNTILDTVNKAVWINGMAVKLSKTEFNLLEYLMFNKNKVLSKEQIISKVWDFDSDVLSNTVEVYIGYLRKKLKKDTQLTIRTARGFGYVLEDTNV